MLILSLVTSQDRSLQRENLSVYLHIFTLMLTYVQIYMYDYVLVIISRTISLFVMNMHSERKISKMQELHDVPFITC